MTQETYTLDELADVTGLKSRTIRHYIQQHLLLGPDSLGRNATYSPYHIKRLEVIKDLRRHRFSIEDIRQAFRHARPDEDIRLSVLSEPDMPSDGSPPMEDVGSALGFVQQRQQIMEPVRDYDASSMQSPASASRRVIKQEQSHAPSSSSSGPIEQLLLQLRILSGQRRVARRTRGESWVCFAATPDLEIHVRGQVPADQEKLFEQIADHVRHILLGGDQHA